MIKIHIHSRQGMFTVKEYDSDNILVCTKHKEFVVPTADFKCFAGGLWNNRNSEKRKKFVDTIGLRNQLIMHCKSFRVEEKEKDTDTYFKENAEMHKKEVKELKNRIFEIGKRVYSQNINFDKFTPKPLSNSLGFPFIIQRTKKQTLYQDPEIRMCFDPFEIGTNWHYDIDIFYKDENWYTISGGWLKIFPNTVVLYDDSGRYETYSNIEGIKTAMKIFPSKEIFSYAGKKWNGELENKYNK